MQPPGMIVTGGTGFMGRHLIEAFKADYHDTALSRGSPSLHGVLEAARRIGARDFVFAISVAACAFPAPGRFMSSAAPRRAAPGARRHADA